jgi:hypothetical protein
VAAWCWCALDQTLSGLGAYSLVEHRLQLGIEADLAHLLNALSYV